VAVLNPKLVTIALGDAGGIGPEVTLKAVAAELTRDDARYVLIGDGGVLVELNRKLKLNLPLAPFRADDTQARVTWCDPLTRLSGPSPHRGEGWGEGATGHRPGCAAHARAAIAWLKYGAELCLRGEADALVTAPVNKESIIRSGLKEFVGQTELLSSLAKAERTAMMLLGCDDRQRWLRVALATVHLPIARVAQSLTREKIELAIALAAQACHDLGLPRARVAVCGLNPHAGEGGQIGTEEITTILPAVEAARAKGIDVLGPSLRTPCFTMPFGRLRCSGGDVSRPGSGAAEDDRLRDRRELDSRPAVHPHLARPRHGLRHRRPRHCESLEHDCSHPAGETIGEAGGVEA